MNAELTPRDALVLVDIQRDFCRGGALPVPHGDEVVPAANRWIALAQAGGVLVVATGDQHPAGHCSFAENGGQWPTHCVAGTPGATPHPDLRLPPDALRVAKGAHPDREQYSGFDGTGLAELLKRKRVVRVWIAGLAEDVCVKETALDAARQGFEVHLVAEATRALTPESGEAARAEMRRAGVLVHAPA